MISWQNGQTAVRKWKIPELKSYIICPRIPDGTRFSNNLINAGLYDDYRQAFERMGIDFDVITDEEQDAGLGNGGLKTCRMFPGFSGYTGSPVMGCGIRYEFASLNRRLLMELRLRWKMTGFDGNVWEVERPS